MMFKLPAYTHLYTLILLTTAAPSFAAERFDGQGNLAPSKTQSSADQRFRVIADLNAAPVGAKISSNGRFSVIANLAAPKSLLADCGPVTENIFKNGFEN